MVESGMTPLDRIARLAAICRRAFVREDAPHPGFKPVDAAGLLTLARRHRVQALCWKGLESERTSLSQSVVNAFQQDTRAIAEQGLRTVAASRELLVRFNDAALPLLFLKGQPLGQLAYGEPFLKMSADIDILVRPEDLLAAASILDGLGYRTNVPRDRARIAEWHRFAKESVWVRDGSPPVELHSRVADHPALLPGLTASSPSRLVGIGFGVSLPTFARDELFAYLAVHGASSAWFRLKWLCDFAALLSGSSEEDTERLYRRSIELGAGRASGWALLLSHRLFGTALSTFLLAELERDRALHALEKIALRQLSDVREPTARPLGTFGIHASQLLLKGVGFGISEGARQIRDIVRLR